HDAARAGRAHERRVLPVRPRVLDPIRTQRQARGVAAGARGDPASRPDAPRHGDRLPRRRRPAERCAAAGEQRCPRADGGALPPARRHGREPVVTHTSHPGDTGTGVTQVTPQVLIRNVRLYGEGDPVDVLLGDEQILAIGTDLEADTDAEIVDGTGQIVLPGFVDLHTHLREPGREDTETVDSGSAAAARGGYTAVFAMANTDPVADSVVVTDHVWRRGREVGLVDVHPVGAVTVGLEGKQLAEMGTMAAGVGGVRMFSDDGKCVYDPLLMRRALEYSASLGVLIAQHAAEPRLTGGAGAHGGVNAARLGLIGVPRAALETVVARGALLARHAGARVHICHASTAGTVELVRWARSQGISISAEV